MDTLVSDLKEHEAQDERRFDRILGLLDKRTADDSARFEAVGKEHMNKTDRLEGERRAFRRSVALLLTSSMVSFALGLLAMYLTR